ncbi:flagellar hook-basal body protein [Desulfoscipio geothermicus]|jgi:flagellar hook protein FlgE|uniref:Flagellar hook protein FlgE n=1 Tax=Desulfoscipio geothermicus DSM 3669 TaxID=1121426 RepID=A0A1I6CV74_9FIRM|nr:flagellar hook-basal body complex protein [Desulfoscipio geothermicus]SFQ97060.1 flagellar hook protein FlgE [Desulfoscipio geothermicus DSM 3669]
MIRSLYLGVSGMRNHQIRMDVIGNNISNINTTGFKTSRANFQDTLYQAMGAAGNSYSACQVGTGVSIAGVSNNFVQGPLQATGRKLDLGIAGNGFFGVIDDNGNNDRLKFTRDGSFFFDKDGILRNHAGLKVVDADENEIQLDLDDDQSIEDIEISETGELFIGKESTDKQIGLFNFLNVAGLTRAGDNLFLENDITGERTSNQDGAKGFGIIRSGFLEMSNIDIADELANLIATQRGYQANAKVFTTADEVIQETTQLKR